MDNIVKASIVVDGKESSLKDFLLNNFRGPDGEKPINVTFELKRGDYVRNEINESRGQSKS